MPKTSANNDTLSDHLSETNFFLNGHMQKKCITSSYILEYYTRQFLYIKSILVKLNANSDKIFSNLVKIESDYNFIKLSKPKNKKFKTIFFVKKNNIKLLESSGYNTNINLGGFNDTYFCLQNYYKVDKLTFFKKNNCFCNNKNTLSVPCKVSPGFNHTKIFYKTFDLKLVIMIQNSNNNFRKRNNFNNILLNKINLIKVKNLLFNKKISTILNALSIYSPFTFQIFNFNFIYIVYLISKNIIFYSYKKKTINLTNKNLTYVAAWSPPTIQVGAHILKTLKIKNILKYYINSIICSSLSKLLFAYDTNKIYYFNNTLSNKNYLIKNLIKKNTNEPLSILISFLNLYNRFFNFLDFQYKFILLSSEFLFGTIFSNSCMVAAYHAAKKNHPGDHLAIKKKFKNRINRSLTPNIFISKINSYHKKLEHLYLPAYNIRNHNGAASPKMITQQQQTRLLHERKYSHWLNSLCNTETKYLKIYLSNKCQHCHQLQHALLFWRPCKQKGSCRWPLNKSFINNLILKNIQVGENEVYFPVSKNYIFTNLWVLQKKKHNNKSLSWIFKKYWFRTFFKTIFVTAKKHSNNRKVKIELKLKKNINILFFKNLISSNNYLKLFKIKKEFKSIYNSAIFLNTKFLDSLS